MAHPLEPSLDAFNAADEINAEAIPLGYGVLTDASVQSTPSGETTTVLYTVRQLGSDTAVHASSDIENVRSYVADLATRDRWRLNLDDNSITVSATSVTDNATGQVVELSQRWKPIIGGYETITEYRKETGLHHISVRGDEPPSVGSWHRWPAR